MNSYHNSYRIPIFKGFDHEISLTAGERGTLEEEIRDLGVKSNKSLCTIYTSHPQLCMTGDIIALAYIHRSKCNVDKIKRSLSASR